MFGLNTRLTLRKLSAAAAALCEAVDNIDNISLGLSLFLATAAELISLYRARTIRKELAV